MRPPVLVLGPPRFVGPLGAMRSLGAMGVEVYCLRHREPSIAGASRHCAGRLRAGRNGRPAGADDEVIVEELLEAGRRLGPGAILLAGSDEWATFIAAHGDALSSAFVFPRVGHELVATLTSKVGLHGLATAHGVPTPRIAVPHGIDEAVRMAEALSYPVLLKPIVSRPGEEGLALAWGPEGLAERFAAMGGAGCVLLQEHVRCGDGDIWMYNGYFDGRSRCLAAFTARKVRQHPAGMGVCSVGVCERNDEIIEASGRLLAATGYRGVVDVDWVRDPASGEFKVVDVNPRLGGAFRAMVDRNGLDVVRAMYLDLTGQPVAAPCGGDGRRWMFETADLLAFRRYRRDRGLTLRAWLGSLRGVGELATFAATDPRPFLIALEILVTDTMGGRWRHASGRLGSAFSRRRARSVPAPSGSTGIAG